MGETIVESLKESAEDVKEFFFVFIVVGGFVWIPATFLVGMMMLSEVVSKGVLLLLMLPMMGLLTFVMSFWINYFGSDDPGPPLV